MKKTIRICSKEWDLKYDPKSTGASFETYMPDGRGYIKLGTKWKKKQFRLELLLHEILEAILTTDNKRFTQKIDSERDRYIFVFDHNYVSELTIKILDALASCGELEKKK